MICSLFPPTAKKRGLKSLQDFQLASAAVGDAVAMVGPALIGQFALQPVMDSLTGIAQPLLQQVFCCPLCKMRASRNVSRGQAEMPERCSVAALLTPVLLLGYDWTLSPGEGKSTFSVLKDSLSVQRRSIKVHVSTLC